MKKIIKPALLTLIIFSVSLLSIHVYHSFSNNQTITLSIWHVYGSQTESPMNDIIDKFNQGVGKDHGIVVEVTSISDSSAIDDALVKALNDENLPDIFTAYPRITNKFDHDLFLNWNDYFSEKELNSYMDVFLDEGYFNGKLLMFPIAKSTELFFLNNTLFQRFSNNTTFSDFNNIFSLCNEYYDYSDGKEMLQINDFFHYFYTQIYALGGNFIENNQINVDSKEFETVFKSMARAAIYGGLSTDDGYASDKWKTAELISSIGSTAGIMYMRDYVTYENGVDENIETKVYPYPVFQGAKPTAIQRGTGIFGIKSNDEKKNEAIALFVKWLTDKEQNLQLATEMGYLPVTKEAYDELFANIDKIENDKYRIVYQTISKMNNNYDFISLPVFDNSADLQKNFETNIKLVLSDAHKSYIKYINDGADKDSIMNELIDSSLNSLKAQIK